MAALAVSTEPEIHKPRRHIAVFGEQKGATIALLLLVLCLLVLHVLKPRGIGYFDISTVVANALPLAIGALGLGIVIIAGGIDLSAGAIISLVNVSLVSLIGESNMGFTAYSLSALAIVLAIGGGCGAINGLLVSYLRLQPVVVTLAIMFIAQGVALLIMPSPGGFFSDATSMLFVGDVAVGVLPASVVVVAVVIGIWVYLRRRRLGLMLQAIGSDAESARSNGVDVDRVRFTSYLLAGLFYGFAGLAITANTASGDPLIGAPMLLKLFASVVLGGVAIGGGRGTPVGAVFGAISLGIITTIMLISGIQTYYVPVVEGIILIVAVFAFSANRAMPAYVALKRFGTRAKFAKGDVPTISTPLALTEGATAPARAEKADWRIHLPFIRMVGPAIVLCIVTIAASAAIYGSGFSLPTYLMSILVFTSFLAILGLGQGAVVISGGLDLSVAWTMTMPAVVLTTYSGALDANAAWAIPLALAIGAGIGLFNGALIVGFGLSPIIVTLAVAGILEGLTLIISGGAPTGYVPPVLSAFVNGRMLGLPPIVWFLFLFAVTAFLLLNRSVFGHRLIAVGNSVWVARLSGIRAGSVLIGAYVLSGLCAALAGILLAGFNNQATYDMGRPYLLASIAVVVLGGTDIRGGRGHYLGIFAGALLLTALSSMLSATTLPEAVRNVIYGVVLIAAVLSMRDNN
ncbi:MAG: transporter permease [Rhizobium sp.]|nr:transporter permease [Rhizobium sp.]